MSSVGSNYLSLKYQRITPSVSISRLENMKCGKDLVHLFTIIQTL